jgi:DNA-binding NtrC family response regulator
MMRTTVPVKRLICIGGDGNARALGCPGPLPGWDVCVVEHLAAAHKVLSHQHYGVGLLLDNRNIAGNAGDAGIARFLHQYPHMRWVGVFDAHRLDQPALRELIAAHLFDFHTRPVDTLRLQHSLGHAHGMATMARRMAPHGSTSSNSHIHGASSAIMRLRSHIEKIAAVDAPVLISGESGSGKELAAQEIHLRSQRASGPFIAINCAAMAPALIHSELFGHERGAFTGATRDKQGLLEAASGGSIFLDEIGDLPLDLQASLLRVLQERVIYRVGGTRTIAVDARVITATHVDLPQAVADGRFREDLYYRLSVFPIRVPALRERKDDLPLLTDLIFNKFVDERSPQLKGVSREALQAMAGYDWPGNVRELINRLRRAMVLAEQRLVMPEDLDLPGKSAIGPLIVELGSSRMSAERTAIGESLARSGNNITRAARELGVSRMTLYRLMAKHEISV